MSRRDSYLDATLKHLGTMFYQTLQGEATSSEVAEVSLVREEMARRPGRIRFSSAAITAACPAGGEYGI